MPKRVESEPNGTCQVCKHRERHRFELLAAGGASIRAVSKKFGVNPHAGYRHWNFHVAPERKATLISGPIKLSELADRAADEGDSLLDHYAALRNLLTRRLDFCDIAGDGSQMAPLAGRLAEVLRDMGRLTGQLSKGGVSITNNIFVTPEWSRMYAVLVEALAPHPAARADVLRALRDEERRAQPPKVIDHVAA